jgi:hypothetical protein
MHRRNFLYNSGLLVPAIMLSPASVWASKITIATGILVIQDAAVNSFSVKAVFKSTYHLHSDRIRNLVYTEDGFLVTTHDNSTFLAQKIVVHANYTISPLRSSIKIMAGDKMLDIALDRPDNQNKAIPEFWFVQPDALDASRASSFMQRTRHALLCLPLVQ